MRRCVQTHPRGHNTWDCNGKLYDLCIMKMWQFCLFWETLTNFVYSCAVFAASKRKRPISIQPASAVCPRLSLKRNRQSSVLAVAVGAARAATKKRMIVEILYGQFGGEIPLLFFRHSLVCVGVQVLHGFDSTVLLFMTISGSIRYPSNKNLGRQVMKISNLLD